MAAADPLIDRTLRECKGREEWLGALRTYPAALRLNERAEIGELDLRVVCRSERNQDSPVCREYLQD